MANYWLRRSPAAQPEGPFSGSQLKQMAARGQLAATALLSADQVKWTAASKVKGLFPQPVVPNPAAANPVAAVAAPDPGEPDTYDIAADPAPAQPVFAAPAPVMAQPLAYASGASPQPRNLQWYVVSGAVLLGLGIIYRVFGFVYGMGSSFAQTYSSIQGTPPPGPAPSPVVAAIALLLIFVLIAGMFGLYIYFTIWAYFAHRDIQQFTGGAYPIGPARACGFCWIPLFHLFWLVYMPYKLAEAVEWHLGPGRPIVNPRSIAMMQLGAFPACCCVWGLSNFLLASTASQIQNGLNDLWHNPIQVPGRGR